jgi:hypothetical protein
MGLQADRGLIGATLRIRDKRRGDARAASATDEFRAAPTSELVAPATCPAPPLLARRVEGPPSSARIALPA